MTRLEQLGQITLRAAELYSSGADLNKILASMHNKRAIYGLHEGPTNWLTSPGWIVYTVNVWEWGGASYTDLTNKGHRVIIRLNNGYFPAGTIPKPTEYMRFAQRCGEVASKTIGCHTWIVGNEPNHPQEWPDNQKIYPEQYADCYWRVRAAIQSIPGRKTDLVLVAASAPWCALVKYKYNEKGDWVQYMCDVLARISEPDGISLHTYTRAHDPKEVTATSKMGGEFGHRFSNFQTYRDYMEELWEYRGIPVYITECCPVESGWQNVNNGWIRAVYDEIRRWNSSQTWPIECLCLYRGAPYDRWYFGDKVNVKADWEASK